MWGKRLSKEKRKAGSDIVTDKNVAEDEEGMDIIITK